MSEVTAMDCGAGASPPVSAENTICRAETSIRAMAPGDTSPKPATTSRPRLVAPNFLATAAELELNIASHPTRPSMQDVNRYRVKTSFCGATIYVFRSGPLNVAMEIAHLRSTLTRRRAGRAFDDDDFGGREVQPADRWFGGPERARAAAGDELNRAVALALPAGARRAIAAGEFGGPGRRLPPGDWRPGRERGRRRSPEVNRPFP